MGPSNCAIEVRAFDVTRSNQETTYRCEVLADGSARELRYGVTASSGHPRPSLTANWAAIALLIPAMRAGKSLVIRHSVSALLLYFMRTDLQDLLIHFDKGLTKVAIEADIAPAKPREASPMRIGTGFSAGVDSFSALRTFRQAGIAPKLDVTDLLTFSVGAFGQRAGKTAREAFAAAAQRTAAHAEEFGLHSHSVKSNLTIFYAGTPGLEFARTHTFRNASAAALFERELDLYLYASGISYPDLNLSARYDTAHIDPILLPLLSTPELRFVSAGAGTDRTRKTEMLADDPAAQKMLDVCVTPAPKRAAMVGLGKNCSQCWKCYRTMVTLDALGKLDSFSAIFDVAHFRKNVDSALATLRHRGNKGSKIDLAAVELYEASANKG
jgi:hypothetical protein